MGEINYDPVVDRIRNRVGNFVYTTWKGKNIIKKYNGDSRKPSELQVEIQRAFSVTVSVWKQLHPKMKSSWKTASAGKNATEYNMFIGTNVKNQRNGVPYKITCNNGLEGVSNCTVQSSGAGEISISFDSPGAEVYLTVALHRLENGRGGAVLDIRKNLPFQIQPVTIGGLESGTDYFVYCVFTDRPIDEAIRMTESIGNRVTVH